jgi:hypothetical protein
LPNYPRRGARRYALSGVLGSALGLLIAMRLLAATEAFWSVSLYPFVMIVISFASTLLLSETYRNASLPRGLRNANSSPMAGAPGTG